MHVWWRENAPKKNGSPHRLGWIPPAAVLLLPFCSRGSAPSPAARPRHSLTLTRTGKNGNRAWPVTLFPITLARSMRASLSIFLRALRGRKRLVFMGAAAPERGRTIVGTRAQGLIQATRRVMRSLLAPSAGSRSPSGLASSPSGPDLPPMVLMCSLEKAGIPKIPAQIQLHCAELKM